MPTPGKLDLIIKINVIPSEVTTTENGWKTFSIDCDGIHVTTTLRPKAWVKLEEAAAKWPSWVAALAGKMGQTDQGLALLEPQVQVFERKPKEPTASTPKST